MSLRSKTRQRLLILLVAAFAIVVIVGIGAAVRLAYLRESALRGRSDGLKAIATGDYPTALKQLGRYLSRNQNDADILLLYAKRGGMSKSQTAAT